VVTARPATRRSGVTHATRGWPSTSTVQHPHWPCGLQPSLAVRAPRRSRRASSSEPRSSSRVTARPSTTNSITGEPTVTGVDRRSFLALGAGVVVLGACGGGGSSGGSGANPDLVLVPNDWDYFAGAEYRMAILLASNKQNG